MHVTPPLYPQASEEAILTRLIIKLIFILYEMTSLSRNKVNDKRLLDAINYQLVVVIAVLELVYLQIVYNHHLVIYYRCIRNYFVADMLQRGLI